MKRLAPILFLAACGSDLHHTTDAQPADVMGDTLGASTNDAPAEAVKITIKRGSSTVPNVAVYFQDPASTVVDQKLTNENGFAWALMPTGGFVSAVEHVGPGLEEITTFSAVAPGDSLQLAFMNPGSTKEWPISLTFPPDTNGAGSYTVRSSCSSEAMGIINPAADNHVTLQGCEDGIADFSVVSNDGDGIPTGRAFYIASVSLPTATAGAFPSVALASDYSVLETHSLQYTNVPDTLGAVSALQGISATRRAFDVTGTESRTSSTVTFGLSVPAGATTQLTATVGFPASTEKGQPMILDWGAAGASYALDFATSTLPRYETSPTYSPGTRTVTWNEAEGAVQPDLVRARIHVVRDGVPASRSWGWRIVAPRTTASVTYPQLPVVDFDFNPTAGDIVGVDELTNVKFPGGYAAMRSTAFENVTRMVSGASGRILVETLYFPEL